MKNPNNFFVVHVKTVLNKKNTL